MTRQIPGVLVGSGGTGSLGAVNLLGEEVISIQLSGSSLTFGSPSGINVTFTNLLDSSGNSVGINDVQQFVSYNIRAPGENSLAVSGPGLGTAPFYIFVIFTVA